MGSRESEFKTLTDIGTIGRGKSKHRPRNDPDLYGGDYPFVQTGDVKHAPFYLTEWTQTYNERGLAQSKLWPPGTLCITIAANIADTAILRIPACFPDSILGFAPKRGLSDVRYVKYCLDGFRAHMELISRGTTQDNLSLDKLLKLRFWFPHIEVQRKIAAILSAYDDLIANNQRRIALLEGMAEEIYREWFVRMRFPGSSVGRGEGLLPRGWSRVPMGELSRLIKRGVSPDYSDQGDGVVLNQKCIRDGKVSLAESRRHQTNVPGEKFVRPGDVLINSTGVGTLGRVALFDMELDGVTCDSHITILRADSSKVEPAYLGPTIAHLQGYFESMASGATGQAELSRDLIARTKVLVPDEQTQKLYAERTVPMLKQRRVLQDTNVALANMRDALLPRLISGKLKVDHLDIRLPPSMKVMAAA
jgi:type I restriction enzyme, S subunit